jgi:hypothetical protein
VYQGWSVLHRLLSRCALEEVILTRETPTRSLTITTITTVTTAITTTNTVAINFW